MRKNYIATFLVFLSLLFWKTTVQAQLQAVDDNVAFPWNSPITTINVLSNDTLNGNPVSLSQITVNPAQAAYMTLDSSGNVNISPGAPPGNYVLTYQICMQGAPNTCAIAIVSLTVFCPIIDPPHVSNVVQPTCANQTGSITVDNVPPQGMLNYFVDGAVVQTVMGSGSITIPTINVAGVHNYVLYYTDGMCNSAYTTVDVIGTGYFAYTMTDTYVDFNGNGVTDVGDIIEYHYTLYNNGCEDLLNLQVHSGQFPVNGGPLGSLPIGATDSATFSNIHVLTQADITAGYVNQSSYATATTPGGSTMTYQAFAYTTLNISDGIKFVAFIDQNNNGIKDVGETDFSLGHFNYILNNDGISHHLSSTYWPIIYETNPANSYNLSYSVESGFAPYYSVTTVYNNVTVANGSGVTTYYFPVIAVPYTDLSVHMIYFQPPRPGFVYTNQLFYTNNGNQPIASGTITFTNDTAVTITSTSPATTATPTGFTYNFTNLLPNETRYITISMPVPTIPTVSLGQLINNSATASIPAGDVNTNNNSYTLSRAIVGSYDPNEKSESHGGKILVSDFDSNDYLTYTIWFENTGTAEAINVRVSDLLDSQLDETTVRTIRASHPYTMDRVNNALTWTFAGIDLPPSIPNTTTGHGFITFQVKPKAGYAAGDIIPNAADIYFDFNPAIVTNTFNTQFVNSLKTEDFAFNHFRYSPNPVKNVLSLSNNNTIEKVSITSVLGQKVLEKNTNGLQADVDLSGLANGVYLVNVRSANQLKTFKIVKE